MQGFEALAHFEGLNEAKRNQRNGNKDQKIQLGGRYAANAADQRDQRAHRGDDKQAESIDSAAQQKGLELLFIETHARQPPKRRNTDQILFR